MAVAIDCATVQSVAEITDMMTGGKMPEYIVTSIVPVDLPELVRCKDCTKWDRNDGTFRDVDDKEWHNCKTLCFRTMAYFYCADAEREE